MCAPRTRAYAAGAIRALPVEGPHRPSDRVVCGQMAYPAHAYIPSAPVRTQRERSRCYTFRGRIARLRDPALALSHLSYTKKVAV